MGQRGGERALRNVDQPGCGALTYQDPVRLEQGEDWAGSRPPAPLPFPFLPAARAGREDKCSEGRAKILAEAPA